MLKLQAATTIEAYWQATQTLLASAVPSSTRWLCVRPLQMKTAMMLLRETNQIRGKDRGRGKNKGPSEMSADEAALLAELFARHPAPLHFRDHPGDLLLHLTTEETLAVHTSDKGPLCRCDWVYGAALAFWNQKRIQGLLLLHREKKEGDFAPNELRALRDLHPHLETALSRVISARREKAQKRLFARVLKPLPLPIVICDWRLNIICESAAGREARAIWELGEKRARQLSLSGRRPLPPDLAAHCQSKIRTWERSDRKKRSALEKQETQIHHPGSPHLSARLRLVRQRRLPLIKPLFVLQFEASATRNGNLPGEIICEENFAPLSRLTARERELALFVCRGHSNEVMAQQLGKSVYTIKAQMHSIFAKLKVKSRGQLIASLVQKTPALLLFLSVAIRLVK